MERTFHHHASPLHGITVAVDTTGGEVWVGRCDDEDAERVILLDADVHPPAGDGGGDVPRDEWLARAARLGVWPRHARVVIPRGKVAGLQRLGDLA